MASEFANQGPQISATCISYSPKSPVRRANFWVKRTTSRFKFDLKYGQPLQVPFLLIPLHFDAALALDVDFFPIDRRHLLVLKRELSRAYVVAARFGIRGATASCRGEGRRARIHQSITCLCSSSYLMLSRIQVKFQHNMPCSHNTPTKIDSYERYQIPNDHIYISIIFWFAVREPGYRLCLKLLLSGWIAWKLTRMHVSVNSESEGWRRRGLHWALLGFSNSTIRSLGLNQAGINTDCVSYFNIME